VAGNHIGGAAAELKLTRQQLPRRMFDHSVRLIPHGLFEPDVKAVWWSRYAKGAHTRPRTLVMPSNR
jgi:hypothetical protein